MARLSIIGEKNPNWKPKVDWKCPVCGKNKLVTKKLKIYNEKIGRACSKRCGYLSSSLSRMGRKNPLWSEYMKKNNPMKNPEIVKKVIKSLKESYSSGRLDYLKEKQRLRLIDRNKRRIISENERMQKSEYMKKNNPMFNSLSAKKVGQTLKKRWESRQHPNKNRARPDASEYMKKNNPMKNPEIAFKALIKARQTLIKNGNISKGQKLLYQYLKDLKMSFMPEEPFKAEKRFYFIDAFIADKNVAIEYDGHMKHYYEPEKDYKKDNWLFLNFGIKTLRIVQREIFAEEFAKNKIKDFLIREGHNVENS